MQRPEFLKGHLFKWYQRLSLIPYRHLFLLPNISFNSAYMKLIEGFNLNIFMLDQDEKHHNVTKPSFQLINVTKGLILPKMFELQNTNNMHQDTWWQIFCEKFGQNPLRNVGVAHRRNCLCLACTKLPINIPRFFPSENLAKIFDPKRSKIQIATLL